MSRLVDHRKHGVLPTTSHCCLSASCINLESQVIKWDHVRQLWGRFNDILPSYKLQAIGAVTCTWKSDHLLQKVLEVERLVGSLQLIDHREDSRVMG